MKLLIELSDETKKQIEDKLTEFKKVYPQFQWVRPENYTILIHNFGEFSDKKSTIDRLEKALFDKNSFYLYVLEVVMTIQNNITIFLEFRREKEIERISDSVKQEFSRLQVAEKFIPIIRLATYKIPSKQQYFVIKKRLSNLEMDVSFKVGKLSLFEGDKRLRVFKLL